MIFKIFQLKFLIAGGCRDDEDYKRVSFLAHYAKENYNLKKDVDIEWHLNISFQKLNELLSVNF